MMLETEMKKIDRKEKIKSLEKIYAEFIKLCKPNNSGISFSDLYMRDHLGWDTYIKYFFWLQGLNWNLFVLTAFDSKKINSNENYPNKMNIQFLYNQHIENWKKSNKVANLSHKMVDKPSEYLLDLCWFDISTQKMILGMELEQSREREDIRIKDILFDFYKLLYINSEFKIMISFPWQHQVASLTETMKEIILNVDDVKDDYYLIINISEDRNRGKEHDRKYIDYVITGFILNNKINILQLEKCACRCLWEN